MNTGNEYVPAALGSESAFSSAARGQRSATSSYRITPFKILYGSFLRPSKSSAAC
jgi:hypothetical protein